MSCVLVRVHYVMHTTVMRTNAMPTNVRHINAVCTNVMCTSAMCSNVMCTDVMCTSTYCYVWLSVCIPRETSKLISQDSVKYVHITKSILNLKLSWLVQTLPTMPPWLLSLFHSQFCCCVYLQLCSAVSGIWLWKKNHLLHGTASPTTHKVSCQFILHVSSHVTCTCCKC